MTTPREALENSLIRVEDDNSFLGNMPETIDAILTALASFMRTPGTVEVCERCDKPQSDWPSAKHNGGNCNAYQHIELNLRCPLKQVTNE